MQSNIIKISFLLSYLTMLICVVSGIPFLTALLRSVMLMILLCGIGFFLRYTLMSIVTSVELREKPEMEKEGEETPAEEEEIELEDITKDVKEETFS